MIIAVGSTNEAKVLAVKETVNDSPLLRHAEVIALSTSSGVSAQPLSLEETIQGAKNRSKNAYNQCEGCLYAFGIESGLMEASNTLSGFLHISICSIYDGANYYTGLSSGFELPPQMLDLILNQKIDLLQACLDVGITKDSQLGTKGGLIGLLTNGRIDRKEHSKQCIITAILQLENSHWYQRDSVPPPCQRAESPLETHFPSL